MQVLADSRRIHPADCLRESGQHAACARLADRAHEFALRAGGWALRRAG